MPHSTANKLHRWWAERVVFREFELSCEYSTLKRGASRALDQGFPVEHVIFRHWARSDALRWVGGEVLVFVEQALLGDRGSHFMEFGGESPRVEFLRDWALLKEVGGLGSEGWQKVESR